VFRPLRQAALGKFGAVDAKALLFTCLTSHLGDYLLMGGRRDATPETPRGLATGKREHCVG